MEKTDKTAEQMEKSLEINEIKIQNHEATLKILERLMEQIHGLLSQRQPRLLPSDTISLRSGKQLEEGRPEVVENDNEAVKIPKNDVKVNEEINEEPRINKKLDVRKARDITFLSRLKKQVNDKQYSKILEFTYKHTVR